MILRSSALLFNASRAYHGSGLGQLPRKILLSPKYPPLHGNMMLRNLRRSPVKQPPHFSSQLRVPFLFTVTTATACVLGYQHLGILIPSQIRQPDWLKCYALICGSCIVVFSAYRLAIFYRHQFPSFMKFMERYCVTKGKPDNAVEACAQLVLSAFCHISPIHLGINMYILYTATRNIVADIGKEKFLGCYIFSAVIAGFTSMAYQVTTGRIQGSVGASGAILGLLAMVVHQHPEYSFYIIFLPMIPIPGPQIFAGLVTLDTLGIIRGWQFFDHAGHLGGMLSGLMFSMISKAKETSFSSESALLSKGNKR